MTFVHIESVGRERESERQHRLCARVRVRVSYHDCCVRYIQKNEERVRDAAVAHGFPQEPCCVEIPTIQGNTREKITQHFSTIDELRKITLWNQPPRWQWTNQQSNRWRLLCDTQIINTQHIIRKKRKLMKFIFYCCFTTIMLRRVFLLPTFLFLLHFIKSFCSLLFLSFTKFFLSFIFHSLSSLNFLHFFSAPFAVTTVLRCGAVCVCVFELSIVVFFFKEKHSHQHSGHNDDAADAGCH